MANYRAIKVACEGVLKLLKSNFRPDDFNNTQFQFEVYLADDFAQPMAAGVSLFLYRVYINHSHRTPAGRIGPDGQRFKTMLPLDLHFLLTVWGKDASLQHTIIGWLMRVLEDSPILPPGLLNSLDPGVFHPEETVEIIQAELNNEDFISIWRDMIEKKYQLSVPYMARNIWIESNQALTNGAPVQQRTGVYNV
ncbi:MAG TPA: DUF4255 domain-containing protein [Candidatus Deferrimicrobium sp.]|nr:DUF4255 domain-containing protein [Candidatus Deferrimicrobium sp.]